MTTYDLTNDIGKVRLIIGDTDIADAVFTDAEIQVFIDMTTSLRLAAAMAARAWASKYSANADSEKIGDYAYTQKIMDKLLALADKLEASDAAIPYLTWSEMDLEAVPGGIEAEMGE